MVDFKISLLLIVAVINVFIGLLVLFRQHRDPARVAFVVFTVGISLWALTNALFQVTQERNLAILYALLSYYAGILIAIPFYSFASNFPSQLDTVTGKRLRNALILYTVVWIVVITVPGLTLRDVIFSSTTTIQTGPGLWFHFMSIVLLITVGLSLLWRKRRKSSDHVIRRQIGLILFGSVIAALGGIVFNLIFPLVGNYNLVWLGPDFSLVLVVFMAYAIVRHNLFHLRIIATEVFTALLGLILIIQVLRSGTMFDLTLRLFMFVLFLYVGWQLLKSVYEEIRAKEALKRLLDAKTDFIHAASHQLRTPLSGIRGMLTMLFEGDYDAAPAEEKAKAQQHVLQATERLVDTVNDLLYAAEVEQGIVSPTAEGQVELLVQQSLDTLRPNFTKKGLVLNYTPSPTPLPRIPMRANFLQQVFLNILDNAERYTPAPGKVNVQLYQEHDQIIFEVRDSGIGLTPEDEAKLFIRFGRSEAAKDMQPNGSGLGLYIVKRIVEEHGGTITAHSPGRNLGTTFLVTLPITPF